MSQRVLVTGAAGRLGSAVSAQLHEEGIDFLATDIVDPGEVPYRFRQADLLDHTAALDLLEGMDAVIHIGNHPGLGPVPPQVVFSQNTAMNANVFQGSAERGVGRIIFASTLQLIGSHPDTRTVVSTPPLPSFPLDGDTKAQPANLYALGKTIAEHMLTYYAQRCGMTCVALRLPLLHNHNAWVGVDTGSETEVAIHEGFTGLSYRDAASLFVSVLRSDIVGYRCFMAGTAHRHNDLDLPSLIEMFYPDLPSDLEDLIDNTVVGLETGWEPCDDYNRPRNENDPS